MKHVFNNDFISISRKIVEENKSLDEWAQIESSDMFQEGSYIGGFDAIEVEFTFSVFENNKEFWFQLSLDDIQDVLDGKMSEVDVKDADN